MDKRVIYVLEQQYNKDGEYIKNDMYTNRDRQVYTHKDNEALWLCYEQIDKQSIQVTKTFDDGVISMRDNWQIKGNMLQQLDHEDIEKKSKGIEERIAEKKAIIKAREEAKRAKQKASERN